MKQRVWWVVSTLAFALPLSGYAEISKECKVDQECIIDVEGTTCADGTKSFYTLTKRANPKGVLVYLHGGGGCWSKETCEKGLAKPLTRVEEPTDWVNGSGIHDGKDAANPLAKDYDIVTVPYCTGDAYTGNNEVNYGTTASPYIIRHRGHENVKKILASVKTLYPNPAKAVLAGCSAGGIGAYYHLRNFAATFPDAQKYVISDAGTPFKPPYVKATTYGAIMKNWGADKTLPLDVDGKPITDFGGLIKDNTTKYDKIRFGFISSYRDKTMTFFALALGAPSPFTAVKETIINVANNDIGDRMNSRVFYVDSSTHCFTPHSLKGTVSEGKDLGTWLNDMVEDYKGWDSIRPDKHRVVQSALDAGETKF